ncbi:amino acid ABC transporter substrate-binding protein [Herbaspirillum sp. 3R11]|nr:amino acid ABC transporter substrate-binding protein [Herbaspirillum sp. 3R-3a1]TFI08289.1 amino acid ABC transporter substrate-binding protein [Herbaspirillum sp. 3R11]TFI14704.1 amino acid ABC transporter substrate-binding protein [Herbaspirillum sp. 3R-11]TFI31904.1 amino acid ABC transporter substrate-binding protein [Herbaspirillum sp. 3C11]TFI32013.1 amino acid ABC transporter substrate-binding protein [Herbaspirillum sp. 3C11]
MKALKFFLAALAVVSVPALSQETGILKKIKESGTLTLGVRDSSIPFSYLDDKQSYQGYAIDICMRAAKSIQKKLALTSLNIKMVPVTSSTRLPLIANGTIDLECGSTSNNIDRQKQVSFAPTTFITANRILAKKSSNIKTLDDLKGKNVVSTAGTTNLKQIATLNTERGLGMNVLSARDHAEAFLMVETGRASAFVMDDILLASLAATSKNPADFMIGSEALSVEPYGIIEPKHDPAFKKVVDDVFIEMMKNGEMSRLYSKWFQTPIPPKGVNLNVPMSAELQAVIKNPTDSGDPAAYVLKK